MMYKRSFGLILLVVFLMSFVAASVETEFMDLVNAERERVGRVPLSINSDLNEAGTLHSKDMAQNNYFSHTSLDGRSFSQRIAGAGYTGYSALGENIAYHSGSPNATKVYSMWRNSPGHYSNMINSLFNEAGLGIWEENGITYYTMDLGKRRTTTNSSGSGSSSGGSSSGSTNVSGNTGSGSGPSSGSGSGSIKPAKINDTVAPILSFRTVPSNKKGYVNMKIYVTSTEKAKISYVLGNISKSMCSSCDRSTISVKMAYNSSLEYRFSAVDKAGNQGNYTFVVSA